MKKSKKSDKYQLLVYVQDASMKIKRFSTKAAMGKFIDDYLKKNPDYADLYSDNWIEFAITDVSGTAFFFTDGLEVE